MEKTSENKWWENYAVRYLIGTIVGAGIVAFLNQHPGSPFKNLLASLSEIKDVTSKEFTVFATIGFAFCYVSSAPILVLHATREHLGFSLAKANRFRWPITIAILVTSYYCLKPYVVSWWCLSVFVGIFGIQLFLFVTAILNRFKGIEQFYLRLCAARSVAANETGQYVESYRHLREHGNAFFVLILEASLALILFHLPNASSAIPLLLVWIFPASACWLVGTILEIRFANTLPKSCTPVG